MIATVTMELPGGVVIVTVFNGVRETVMLTFLRRTDSTKTQKSFKEEYIYSRSFWDHWAHSGSV